MRRSILCLCVMFSAAGIAFRLGVDLSSQPKLSAQELKKKSKDEPKKESASDAHYPAFAVRELLEELTTIGAKLQKQGKTHGDAQLRKGLNRESIELELPELQTQEISDKELYRWACESVFIVGSMYRDGDADEWDTALATAFAVTSDGVLTTSSHVFDNEEVAEVVVVMDVHRNVFPVRELLAVNRAADTCLFQIDAPPVKPLPLAKDASPGTRLRVLGHPGDSFYFLSIGTLANYQRDSEGATWLNITADFGQGSSGGPVMDDYGNVIGQVSRTFTLYAGGPARRGRPRRVQGEKLAKVDRDVKEKEKPTDDVADPQMVFKSCVPVNTLRALVKPKVAAAGPK